MKKKGFTLIEVITVIVILAIIALLIVPKVSTLIKNSKENSQATLISTIKDAAKSYAHVNIDTIDNSIEINGRYYVTLITLQENGLLKTYLNYPNGDAIPSTAVVEITKNGNLYEYTFIEEGVTSNSYKLVILFNSGSTTQVFDNYYETGTSITLQDLTRKGHTFTGWQIVEEDSTSTLNENVFTMGNESTTIRGNFTADSYNLIVNLDNGNTTQTFNPTYKYENIIELVAPTRNGYTFNKWTTSGNDSSIRNNNIFIMGSENTTLRANWTPITYSIGYTMNGGTNNSNNPASYNIETSTITLQEPTRNGYTFTGWTGTGLSNLTKNVSIAKGSIGNKSYTANWTPITYSISYTMDGGTNNSNNPASYNIGTSTITLQEPTRDGYTFTGWTGTNLSTLTKSVSITKGSTGNRSYTAHWKETLITYTLLSSDYHCSNVTVGTAPFILNYTGRCELINDQNDNWRIKFLSDGTLTVNNKITVDLFAVGGGGGGGGIKYSSSEWFYGAGGGGGGKTSTSLNKELNVGTYDIKIGDSGTGGTTSGSNGGTGGTASLKSIGTTPITFVSAEGGSGGTGNNQTSSTGKSGGAGGSGGGGGAKNNNNAGGKGGSYGADGSAASSGGAGGAGQNGTTCEFKLGTTSACNTGVSGYPNGVVTDYAGGGGGGSGNGCSSSSGGIGGTGGGTGGSKCDGNGKSKTPPTAGTDNTGGGGGGANYPLASTAGARGGTGIVIIRNKR